MWTKAIFFVLFSVVYADRSEEANPFANKQVDSARLEARGSAFCRERHQNKEFSYMVSIWQKSIEDVKYERTLIAGGVLVTSRHVVTSFSAIELFKGSKFSGSKWNELEVFVGRLGKKSHIESVRLAAKRDRDQWGGLSNYNISRVKSIDSYWVIGNLHDLAIIELDTDVDMSETSTVCIPREKLPRVNMKRTAKDVSFQVVGWGRIDDYGTTGKEEKEMCQTFLESTVKAYCHVEAFKYLHDYRRVEKIEQWGPNNPRTMCLMLGKGRNACSYYTKGAPVLSSNTATVTRNGQSHKKFILLGISIYSLKCENKLLATDTTTYYKFISDFVNKYKQEGGTLTEELCECSGSQCN